MTLRYWCVLDIGWGMLVLSFDNIINAFELDVDALEEVTLDLEETCGSSGEDPLSIPLSAG